MKSGPQIMGKKPNLVMSYSVATMCRKGALHVIESHMKGHLVIVVTAGYSRLAARCCSLSRAKLHGEQHASLVPTVG